MKWTWARFAAVSTVLIVLAGTAGTSVAVEADEVTKADARRLYEEAEKHYALAEYTEAIEKYRAAYRLVPEAVFLFNIAQAFRLHGDFAAALRFYRNYLDAAPDAPNRATVEALVVRTETRLAALAGSGTSSGKPADIEPGTSASGGHGKVDGETGHDGGVGAGSKSDGPSDAAALVPSVAPGVHPGTAVSGSGDRPLHRKPWFWVIVGGSAVAAGVASVLVIALSGPEVITIPPSGTLGTVDWRGP